MKKEILDFIHTLWDELADFDAAHADEALRHLKGCWRRFDAYTMPAFLKMVSVLAGCSEEV